MCRVKHPNRCGSDANLALINMWKHVQNGWKPPISVTEQEYRALKAVNDPYDPRTAFAAFACSHSGKWFGGYARGGLGRNYAKEGAASIAVKAPGILGVTFSCSDYSAYTPPSRSTLIYCDPPYAGTTGYGCTGMFDGNKFWEWCRERSAEGHKVVVSEYAAPSDFVSVWRKSTKTDMHGSGRNGRTEHLFVHRGVI